MRQFSGFWAHLVSVAPTTYVLKTRLPYEGQRCTSVGDLGQLSSTLIDIGFVCAKKGFKNRWLKLVLFFFFLLIHIFCHFLSLFFLLEFDGRDGVNSRFQRFLLRNIHDGFVRITNGLSMYLLERHFVF